ncbi:CPBP family intramembrane glutamic endopeptidase [Falsibacillus albus]|nr:CPBP family intramembrane glutamic endopeptidase [Falsibacillus albus]
MEQSSNHYGSEKPSWGNFVWGVFFTFILVPILSGIIVEIPSELYSGKLLNSFDSLTKSSIAAMDMFVMTILELAITCLFIYRYKPIRELIFPAVSFSPFKFRKTYLYFVLSFFIIFLANIILDYVFPSATKEQLNSLSLENIWSEPGIIIFMSIITTSFIVPVYEEVIFRGIILRFFHSRFSFSTSAICSSFLFGAAHFYSIGIMISAFLAGLILSILYRKTNSILPGILFHMINNLLSYFVS